MFVVLALISFNVYLVNNSFPDGTYDAAIKALQGSTFIFAICVSLATILATNYVRGLRESFLKQVSNIQGMLEIFHKEHSGSTDEDVQEIINVYVLPLLYVTPDEWSTLDLDPIKKIRMKLEAPFFRLFARSELGSFPRQLIRIDEAFFELTLLYIRRGFSSHLAAIVSGSFLLIISGISVLTLLYFFPRNIVFEVVGANLAVTIITFSIIEVLMISGYFRQFLGEEYPDELEPMRITI